MIKQILSFNWLLGIKVSEPLVVILLFPLIYIIWIFKIGQVCELQLNRKRNVLFRIAIINLFIVITVSFITQTLGVEINEFIEYSDIIKPVFMIITLFSWLYSSIYATNIYLRLVDNNACYLSLVDRVHIFFQITFWVFGLWVLQPKINKLVK